MEQHKVHHRQLDGMETGRHLRHYAPSNRLRQSQVLRFRAFEEKAREHGERNVQGVLDHGRVGGPVEVASLIPCGLKALPARNSADITGKTEGNDMRRALLGAASVTSGLLLALGTTSSAQAYPIATYEGYASSSAYGYGAYQVDTNGYGFIYAMDTYADGYRIVSSVYNDSRGERIAYVEDANGSGNGSGAAIYDYDTWAGDSMHFVTCRQNGSSGTPFNCKTTYFTAPY